MNTINKIEFENLCSIEQKRVYEQKESPSYLFWIDKNNKLQASIFLNLLGVDFVKKDRWEKIIETQLRKDFKQWLFQEWQKPCLLN